MARPTLHELSQALKSAVPRLDDERRRVAASTYRTLAAGEPARVGDIAGAARVPEPVVAAALDEWPGVYRDEQGRVIGFWGLALPGMAHEYRVGGRHLSTWCAWDPLFITPLLGEEAEVRSADPMTGEPVVLRLGPEGVRAVDPEPAVVSFLVPEGPWDADVVAGFCHFVLFFASEESGRRWVADHPGTFLVSVDEAYRIGQAHLANLGMASAAR